MSAVHGDINTGSELYTHQRFLFMSLDPVHIGAGGYRLGRVDNTIAREPGTNLPKIPGTSLAGAARTYAAMRYGKPEAAGQHKRLTKEAKDGCPIIYTFGTATDGTEGGAETGRAGTVSIADAHLLFFPVYSMNGPVWVSTIEQLTQCWGQSFFLLPKEADGIKPIMPSDAGQIVTSLTWNKPLNLGWLLLDAADKLKFIPPAWLETQDEWLAIQGRIVLVTPKLFSQIVNSNLEVRTSVSINPETGAAQDGALFTYEAIPRAAWFFCDVVEDDYHKANRGLVRFPTTQGQYKPKPSETDESAQVPVNSAADPTWKIWEKPMDVVRTGFELIEYLGVGGMGTRGFGRMRRLGDWNAGQEIA